MGNAWPRLRVAQAPSGLHSKSPRAHRKKAVDSPQPGHLKHTALAQLARATGIFACASQNSSLLLRGTLGLATGSHAAPSMAAAHVSLK